MAQGIESVSLNPDTVVDTWLRLAQDQGGLSAAMENFLRSGRALDSGGAFARLGVAHPGRPVRARDRHAGWRAGSRGLLDRLMHRFAVEEILRNFLRNLAYAVSLVIVFIAALDFAGVPTTSLLAVVGAAGLGIGLALKDSLSNIASGRDADRASPLPCRRRVQIAGLEGVVESVRIFQTRMHTADNREIILPNSQITSSPIINLHRARRASHRDSAGDGLRRRSQGRCGSCCCRSRRAIRRCKAEPAPEVLVTAVGEATVSVLLRAWVRANDYPTVHPELLETILARTVSQRRAGASRCRLAAQRVGGAAQPSHEQPVVGKFIDRLADVGERGVAARLAEALQQARRPAPRQFLERADVEVAVVEISLQSRHQPDQEAAVLADRVAADRRLVRLAPIATGTRRVRASACASVTLAGQHPVPQPRLARCVLAVPVVHRLQALDRMADRQLRAFGEDVAAPGR